MERSEEKCKTKKKKKKMSENIKYAESIHSNSYTTFTFP